MSGKKDKQPAIKKESIDKMVAGWLSILSSRARQKEPHMKYKPKDTPHEMVRLA